jgi:glycine hydroxymethyltransferase
MDFLFRGELKDLDESLYELLEIESERQYRKLILIPSESTAPLAVRETLSSAFQNIYAEGYPDEESRLFTEDQIFNYEEWLAHYRRYSDPRYYKGVEYADILESLARHRCAILFAANGISSDDIYVNVQPLSGAPANNAVYHALINPGDTIMGMNLLHGGHLSHGSPVHRSGKYYDAVHYEVDPVTEKIDYDQIASLALQHHPKVIVAGYSSYPWTVEWKSFREIADSVGAFLLADIAHVAGLVAAGVYPSPIGIADVVTFTTHKSLCGPRGACILTTNQSLARKIDRAVFPGEQGGPHVNTFAGMALTFKLALSPQFKQLQQQIVKNCIVFTNTFAENGFKIPFKGTNTHLMNLDCGSIIGKDGTALSGDQAARILDLVGIVVNRNTIPGDKSAFDPSGIRMGTPWVTQRGLKEPEMIRLAQIIIDLFKSTTPYTLTGQKGKNRRAKIEFGTFEESKLQVRALAQKAGIDFDPSSHGYPHFYYLDDVFPDRDGWTSFEISGEHALSFLEYGLSCDVSNLTTGDIEITCIHTTKGTVEGTLAKLDSGDYHLSVPTKQAGLAVTWLRDLSDGYIAFEETGEDSNTIERKLPGPVIVRTSNSDPNVKICKDTILLDCCHPTNKPYFIGINRDKGDSLPKFVWLESENNKQILLTPIYSLHKEYGAKMIPFAGWEMPVWYTSALDEHRATRETAGLFDVTHMGVFQAEGGEAAIFLDCVCANDIGNLAVGESCYTHLLDPDANVIDDLLVYRRDEAIYLLVVNAANEAKDWNWLNAVKSASVMVDKQRPWSNAFGRGVILRDLKKIENGADMRVDIALQGPKSKDILFTLEIDADSKQKINALKRTQLCEANVGGYDLIISRTGYTGEKLAYELFVHPDKAASLFSDLLECGQDFKIKPVGLGARDSLRTEAGLPLYGHEMGVGSGRQSHPDLGVGEAGFANFIKTYKPWFIGRDAYLLRERARRGEVIRFNFIEKGIRMAHQGDMVVNQRGHVIGWVTSCAINVDGLLTGQAFLITDHHPEGEIIFVYQGVSDPKELAIMENSKGMRVQLPSQAVITNRFY